MNDDNGAEKTSSADGAKPSDPSDITFTVER
jgi:hypothetical protein